MAYQTALITGGAKRIGKEICLHLAKQGYNILLHYNTSSLEAQLLQNEIIALGVNCEIEQANFLNESDVEQLFSNHKFDLLINNASEFYNCNINQIDYTNLERHFKVNLYAPIVLSKRLINNLSYSESKGSIINILDYYINKMPKNFVAYAFSKKSLWEFTQLLASEAAPQIRVNAIAFNDTLRAPKQSLENFQKNVLNSPLQLSPTLEEVCNTISYLLNSPSITGQSIFLDGGKHLDKPEKL